MKNRRRNQWRWHCRSSAPRQRSARTKKSCKRCQRAGGLTLSSKIFQMGFLISLRCYVKLFRPASISFKSFIPWSLQIRCLSWVPPHSLSELIILLLTMFSLLQVRRHCAVAACQERSFRNGPRVSCTSGPWMPRRYSRQERFVQLNKELNLFEASFLSFFAWCLVGPIVLKLPSTHNLRCIINTFTRWPATTCLQ